MGTISLIFPVKNLGYDLDSKITVPALLLFQGICCEKPYSICNVFRVLGRNLVF